MAEDKQGLTADDLALVSDGAAAGGDGAGDKGAGDKGGGGDKVSVVDGDKGKTSAEGDDASDDLEEPGEGDDAEGDKTATGDKASGKTADGKKDDKNTEGGESDDDPDSITADAKDKDDAAKAGDKGKAGAAWSDVRAKTVDKLVKRLETALAKKVTAAELPKELEKARKRLESQLGRYASLEDALLAGVTAQEKIRSGASKQPLAEDATEDEKTEWRKQNGIPEEAKAYDIAKVAGHTWTDADAPMLESFKEAAFAGQMPQAHVNVATTWFAKAAAEAKEKIAAQQLQTDRADTKAAREVLKAEMEADYLPSMKLMTRLLEDPEVFPDGSGQRILEARDSNGRRIINDPALVRLLVERAVTKEYGVGGMPSGDAVAALSSRKEELAKVRDTDIGRFRRDRNAAGQTMAEELLEIERKEAARGKRAA